MSSKTQQKNRPRLGRGVSSLISISELPVQAEIPQPAEGPGIELPGDHPHRMAPVAGKGTDASASAVGGAGKVSEGAPLSDGQAVYVAIASIVPNPHQPRQTFDDATLAELAASIRSSGLIQPILVRPDGESYQLIAGERRWRAARLAGLKTIPALVRDVDSVMQAQMALIENIQREDLNPLDRAQGYRTLIDQLGLTQVELAARLGEDRSSIANFLRLLDLAEPVKAMLRDGRLSLGHAKLIAGVNDILEQERLANLVVLQGLSVRNLERAMKEGPKAEMRRPAGAPSPHIQDLEKNIARQLGLRVQVRAAAKKGKGKLIIHYANLEQFDELLGRLGVRAE